MIYNKHPDPVRGVPSVAVRPKRTVGVERLTAAFGGSSIRGLAAAFRAAARPRQFELYGIGLPKSGTHSIASMFSPTFRARHEADGGEMIDVILDLAAGRRSSDEILTYLAQRRQRLNVEADASQLNAHVLEYLVSLSDEARFVLTVRDPYSWLDSFVNHSLARNTSRRWLAFRDLRFGSPNMRHGPKEQVLKDRGLYTLDGYFGYWRWHVERSLRIVPEDRLLVVRTDELSARATDVARFVGLTDFVPERQRTHTYRAAGRFGILNNLDPDYLHDTVTDICGALVEELFPDLPHPRELRAAFQSDDRYPGP
jgi:hypothetical protein